MRPVPVGWCAPTDDMNTILVMPLSSTARASDSIQRSRLSRTSLTAKLRGTMMYTPSAPRNARASADASSTSATATSAPDFCHLFPFSGFLTTTRTGLPIAMSASAAQPPVFPEAPRITYIVGLFVPSPRSVVVTRRANHGARLDRDARDGRVRQDEADSNRSGNTSLEHPLIARHDRRD